jgi:hypothetical protein
MTTLSVVTGGCAAALMLCLGTGAVQAQTPPTRTPAAPAVPAADAAKPIQLPSFPAEPAPAEGTLGVPMYPTAHFIRSFDAGRGQRFYLFGAQASFAEIVAYYRTILKSRGEVVFEQPATQFFELGRFREETMAVTPGVTVKDYSGTAAGGYLNTRGSDPARFATIIQVVPPAPGER